VPGVQRITSSRTADDRRFRRTVMDALPTRQERVSLGFTGWWGCHALATTHRCAGAALVTTRAEIY
jgi:hypothetical protein